VTAALVVDHLDVPAFRRLVELAAHVYDSDDPAAALALELLELLDRHDDGLEPEATP